MHGHLILVDANVDMRRARKLVERRGKPATRRVAKRANAPCRTGVEHRRNQMVERGGVRLDLRREAQLLARRDNRDAVVANAAADENLIARPNVRRGEIDTVAQLADASRVDVDAIAMTAVDDLGVTRHDLDAGFLGRRRHRRAHTSQVVEQITLLEHEAAGKVARRGSACRDIIDRTAHGQMPDVSTRKEMRRHHEGVRRERNAPTRDVERRRIIAAPQRVACVCLEEQLLDDIAHHRSATAMCH